VLVTTYLPAPPDDRLLTLPGREQISKEKALPRSHRRLRAAKRRRRSDFSAPFVPCPPC